MTKGDVTCHHVVLTPCTAPGSAEASTAEPQKGNQGGRVWVVEEGLCAYLSRHVSGGTLGLQLEQALRDDLWALLASHELFQRPQNLHKHLTPQRQADQPGLRLHAGNPAAGATAGCQPSSSQSMSVIRLRSELVQCCRVTSVLLIG